MDAFCLVVARALTPPVLVCLLIPGAELWNIAGPRMPPTGVERWREVFPS
jgi:hypothetical protein